MKNIYFVIVVSTLTFGLAGAEQKSLESEKKLALHGSRFRSSARELPDALPTGRHTRFSIDNNGEIFGITAYGAEWRPYRPAQHNPLVIVKNDPDSPPSLPIPTQHVALPAKKKRTLPLNKDDIHVEKQKDYAERQCSIVFSRATIHNLGEAEGIPDDIHSLHNNCVLTWNGDVYDIASQKLQFSFPDLEKHWYDYEGGQETRALLSISSKTLVIWSEYYQAYLYMQRLSDTKIRHILLAYPAAAYVTPTTDYVTPTTHFSMSDNGATVVSYDRGNVFLWNTGQKCVPRFKHNNIDGVIADTLKPHPKNIYPYPFEMAQVSSDGEHVIIMERFSTKKNMEAPASRNYRVSNYSIRNGRLYLQEKSFPKQFSLPREAPGAITNTFDSSHLIKDPEDRLQLIRMINHLTLTDKAKSQKLVIDALDLQTVTMNVLYEKTYGLEEVQDLNKQTLIPKNEIQPTISRNKNYVAWLYTPPNDSRNFGFESTIKRIMLYNFEKPKKEVSLPHDASVSSLTSSLSSLSLTSEESITPPSSLAGEEGGSSSSSSDEDGMPQQKVVPKDSLRS